MNTKRIVMLSTAGALALGLTLGGVGMAFATEHSDPKAHHAVVPVVPITPSVPVVPITPANGGGGNGGGGHITPASTVLTPQDIWNVAKQSFDSSLIPSARFEPVPGTTIFAQGQAGGQSELYVSKDGNAVTLGVAQGSFASEQAKIAANATLLPGYAKGVYVYEVHGGGTYTGDYEIFAHGYWVSMTSNLFTSPNAAYPLIKAAIEAIPQG